MFQVPPKSELYFDHIKQRSIHLINTKIWDGLQIHRLNAWLGNFTTAEEKYFAACMLDSLIYRSEQQTIALIEELLLRSLPAHFLKSGLLSKEIPVNWLEYLRHNTEDPKLRFVCITQPDDPPTKSGYIILRHFKRDFGVKERWIINPSQIMDLKAYGIQTFIFADDFLGSGNQFEEVCDMWRFESLINEINIIYSPLVAHQKGILNLNTRYNKLAIVPVETLDNTHNIFQNYFNDELNNEATAIFFYNKLLEDKNIKVVNPYGYGDLSIVFAFQHAAPDNSLPLIWYNENGWRPLFNR